MQTKYSGKPKWSDLADELWDSDGCQPDQAKLVDLMQEFKNTGGISGFFFCDTSQPGSGPDHDMYQDSWHDNELRTSWECGPSNDDIDFTGLPK
jgi:hypothetical protein